METNSYLRMWRLSDLREGQHEGQGYTPKWQGSSMVKIKIFLLLLLFSSSLFWNLKSSSPAWYENLRSVLSCSPAWYKNLPSVLPCFIFRSHPGLYKILSFELCMLFWIGHIPSTEVYLDKCLQPRENLPELSFKSPSIVTLYLLPMSVTHSLTHIYNISQIMTWFSNINIRASHPLHFNDQLTKYFTHQQ